MKKLSSLFLALILALTLAVPAFAANDYGTIAVSSRYNDNSIESVVLTDTRAWTASNGNQIKGTFTIVFPRGTRYQLPTAEEAWRIVVDSYNGTSTGTNTNGNTASLYTYVGANKGNYIRNSNGTYTYAGVNRGDYAYTPYGYTTNSVTSYNGYGYGDYIYQNGSYTYVGANNGDYARNSYNGYDYVGVRTNYYANNNNISVIGGYNGAGYGDYIYQNGSYIYVGSGNGDYVKSGSTYKWVGYNSSYNSNYNYNNNGYNNNYNYNYSYVAPAPNYTRTAAQQAAENQFSELRRFGETYGWSVDWRPSATTTATNDTCWYVVSAARPTSNTETTFFSFSVYTERSGSSYMTRFKVFENGNQVGNYTLAEVENLLKQYGAGYGTLPCNVFRVNNATAAADSMMSYLRNRGFSISASSNGYSNDSGSSTLVLSRSGYNTVTVRLMADKTSDGYFRCTFAKDGATLTILELLTLFK